MNDSSSSVINPEVDYEKSLKKGRLIYKKNGWLIFTTFLNSLLFFIFFVLLLLPVIALIQGKNVPVSVAIVCIIIISLLISTLWFNNSLIKIKNTSSGDRQNILLTMDEFFSTYDFKINNSQMMRSFKPAYQPVWGRIITILFDGDDMYLNITTLGKSNSPTWVHGLYNYIKAKRIAKYFTKHYSLN